MHFYVDADSIKKILSANQWLVFWLTHYKDEIKDNFYPRFKLQMRGADFLGAKIFSTVTLEDYVLIGEPVRRVDDYDISTAKTKLRAKTERFITLFDNPDYLYRDLNKIHFESRPIINFICEDLEHIESTVEDLKDIMDSHPEQQF